jgi:hypothetical protein
MGLAGSAKRRALHRAATASPARGDNTLTEMPGDRVVRPEGEGGRNPGKAQKPYSVN